MVAFLSGLLFAYHLGWRNRLSPMFQMEDAALLGTHAYIQKVLRGRYIQPKVWKRGLRFEVCLAF